MLFAHDSNQRSFRPSNGHASSNGALAPTVHYLSRLVDKPVLDPSGHAVGQLGDLVVRLEGSFPPVTGLTLRLAGVGRRSGTWATFLHWRQVASVSSSGLTLASARLDLQPFRRRSGEMLLQADLMDQQVMDLNGRKLVRVNDVQLVAAGKSGTDLRLAGIDVGVRGLLRRLDMDGVADWLTRRTMVRVNDTVIPWEGVEPLDLTELPQEETDEGTKRPSLATSGGLRLTHEKLAALHPADVAELVAQLAPAERTAVLESLDAETAAETIGELSPDLQGDVLEDLSTEAALEILAELPPDEAADALAEVSDERADELLAGMDTEDAENVRQLMSYDEDEAGALMTTSYVALDQRLSAQETIEELRRLAPPAEEVYYIYVVDDSGVLVGVLSLRDLIVARPDTTLSEIMRSKAEVVHVAASSPLDDVVEVIEKYNLLAVPVVDVDHRLIGVITVDDVMETLVPEESHLRLLGARR